MALNTDITDPDPEPSKEALSSCERLHDVLAMVGEMEEKVSGVRERIIFIFKRFAFSMAVFRTRWSPKARSVLPHFLCRRTK